MKLKAVFLNQWHQEVPVKKPEQVLLGEVSEDGVTDSRVVSIPPGAIFVRIEDVKD